MVLGGMFVVILLRLDVALHPVFLSFHFFFWGCFWGFSLKLFNLSPLLVFCYPPFVSGF